MLWTHSTVVRNKSFNRTLHEFVIELFSRTDENFWCWPKIQSTIACISSIRREGVENNRPYFHSTGRIFIFIKKQSCIQHKCLIEEDFVRFNYIRSNWRTWQDRCFIVGLPSLLSFIIFHIEWFLKKIIKTKCFYNSNHLNHITEQRNWCKKQLTNEKFTCS